MTAAALGALLGAIGLLLLPAAPPPLVVAVSLWIGSGTLLLRRRSAMGIACACAMLGFAIAGSHAAAVLESRWPAARDGARQLVEVIVESIPVSRGDAWSFEASAGRVSFRVISRDPAVRPRAGERWRLVLALRAPKAPVNPGAVDVELQYFRARIHGLATVVHSRLNERIDGGHRPLTRLREAAARRIDARIDDRDASALIQALAVGATGAMSARQWQVFNATGTAHLVAISGLHVTLFATVAFFLSRRLWSFMLWRTVPWPRDVVAAVIALVASFGYALLAGLSVPTQRTIIMLAAWLLARSLARVSTAFGPLWLALLAVLIADPFAPLAAGLWLSFAAMATIIAVTEPYVIRRGMVRATAAVQFAVTAALAPVSVVWFGSLSAIGVLANALAIPAISGLFVPAILLALLLMPVWSTGSDAVLDFASRLHEWGWPWLVAASELPSAMVSIRPSLWWYPLAIVCVGIALLPLPVLVRIGAVIWILPLAPTATHAEIPHGGFAITVLDVGQGTAVVVRTSSHALLYGTGDVYGTEGRTAENIVVPYLRHEGVERIDSLVTLRPKRPDAEGTLALLAAMPVTRVFTEGGATWRWNGVSFDLGTDGALTIASAAGEARLLGRLLVAEHWAVVSGRRPPAARQPAFPGREAVSATHLLTTDEGGAIRVLFDPRRGPGEPEAMRATQPKLWRMGGAARQVRWRSGMMPPLSSQAVGGWAGCGNSCGRAARSCGRSSCAPSGPRPSSSNASGLSRTSASFPVS